MTLAKVLTLLLIIFAVSAKNKAPFNYTYSKLLANYTTILLCGQRKIMNWTCWNCNRTTPLLSLRVLEGPVSGVRALVGYLPDRNKIVVAWRPTATGPNLLADVIAILVPYPKCKNCMVHTGFYDSYKAVGARVQAYVSLLRQKYPTATISVAGYSLGGALATFSALELQAQQNRVTELYTFGAPRVGNAAYANYINRMIPTRYRPVFRNDIIPQLPSTNMGYKHHANQVFFTEDFKKMKVCDDSGEDRTCSSSVPPLQRTLNDHLAYSYIDQDCDDNY